MNQKLLFMPETFYQTDLATAVFVPLAFMCIVIVIQAYYGWKDSERARKRFEDKEMNLPKAVSKRWDKELRERNYN